MSDAEKRYTSVNAAWLAFTGRTLEAVIGDGWRETIHPDDLPRCIELIDAAFEQHQPYTLEYRLRRHDGEYRWILESGIPLPAPKRLSAGYVGSIVDITERKRAEELLRRKESELTEAQRLAGIGSWQWDCRTGTVTWSEELFRLAGRDPRLPAVSYERHPELYSVESWNRLRAAVDTSLQTGAPYELLLEMICADGSCRWVTARGEVEHGSTGDIIGLRGTVQDITARKHTEEALFNQRRRLLEAQEAERARIARELHDDIAQRLSLLSLALQKLQQSADPSSGLQRSIAALSRETVDIASDLQALSHELHSYKLQLLGLVSAIEGLCSEVSARHKLEVAFTHKDVPGTVRHDIALCLFRVVQEALRNAVRHSAAPRFTVSLESTPNVLTLTVHDAGSGFNPECERGNWGLGLTSMRERVTLVAGELVIESKPGSGTTVVARVPLHERHA